MVKKQIQKHDFLNGGPEIQYSLNFDVDSFGVEPATTINPQFRLTNANDGDILLVTENELRWNGQNIMTEDRINEIVEARIRELGLI
jgi:hypothetical protein